jgi:hypothetical protein
MQWFSPADADLPADVRSSEDARNMTEKIFEYHNGGRSIGFARSAITGILMPTMRLLNHLRHEHRLADFSDANLDVLEHLLVPIRNVYIDLFHNTLAWNTKYAGKGVEYILDVMESFDRYVCSVCFNAGNWS